VVNQQAGLTDSQGMQSIKRLHACCFHRLDESGGEAWRLIPNFTEDAREKYQHSL
jgi:hypothetical protein